MEEVAGRAGVDADYVRRLSELGALEGTDEGYLEEDVHRVALLSAWDAAGLPPHSILEAVRRGELSFDFLQTPGWTLPERPDRTYAHLAEATGVPLSVVLAIHEAIGFQRPLPDDRIRHDDPALVELAGALLQSGVPEPVVLRGFHLYADNLRRLATGEADLYRAVMERGLREAGISEPDLMGYGSQLGQRTSPLVQQTLLAIYERHRQHVWTEISIGHAETALERAGLYERVQSGPPPSASST
jgi:hypothetical protein